MINNTISTSFTFILFIVRGSFLSAGEVLKMMQSFRKLSAASPSAASLTSRALSTNMPNFQRKRSALSQLKHPYAKPLVKLGPKPIEVPDDHPDRPLSANDKVASHIHNRNPMNLERMRIGYKPSGFVLERKSRNYWNKLELTISGKHTTAVVTHWTGRKVCEASTKEWAIARFLYNMTDAAALEVVGKVIGQRCLETGLYEVFLQVEEEDLKKEKMVHFIEAIKSSGLIIGEPEAYQPTDPHRNLNRFQVSCKPWEVVDQ